MRKHVTILLILDQINSVLVEIWVYLTPSSATISQESFKKTYLLPLSQLYKHINHQDYLAYTQTSKFQKVDEIESILKAIISPDDMEEISTADPMVVLRDKVIIWWSYITPLTPSYKESLLFNLTLSMNPYSVWG